MPINKLPKQDRQRAALLIGNGVNRYGEQSARNSWDDLLLGLAARYMPSPTRSIPQGVSTTEFYDLLEIATRTSTASGALQDEFCAPMRNWAPDSQHRAIVGWAKRHAAPILTTNFDGLLTSAANATMKAVPGLAFTDFYPWDRYFGLDQLARPDSGFGIWHINGTATYKRSIRLGLTHYMGSVERARGWLHRGNERRLFSGKNIADWTGASTWLHIVFNRPLLILGLALDENEVFLRWLLIERAKYFKAFPERREAGWFAYVSDEKPGKLYFLESIGIKPIKLNSYDEIYASTVWR